MAEADLRHERVGRVVGGVLRQAVADADAPGLVILEDATPEGALARDWAERALGEARVWPAGSGGAGLVAHPANKTVLLLAPVHAPLLPLGDLYASQVEALAGAWSAPPDVAALAEAAGGIAMLDGALQRWLERGQGPEPAFRLLGTALAARLEALLARNRAARWRPGLVPKLGARTLGVDLFE
ncbi:MAG TPA: hypothetical protein VK939_11070 [Longimicrobiales bacterium]|nr:hypothetical protein [Longimicrobiales bacterium]